MRFPREAAAISLVCLLSTALLPGSSGLAQADGGLPICDAPGDQHAISVAVDFAGSFIAWQDGRRSDTTIRTDIYVQFLPTLVYARVPGPQLLAGLGSWPPNGVAACQSGTAQAPYAVPDDSGGVLILWSDNRATRGIYAQRLLGDGSIAPGWPADGKLITSGVYDLKHVACSDGAGGAYFIRTRFLAGPNLVEASISRITRLGTFVPGWTASGVTVGLDESVEAVDLAPDPAGGAVYTVRTYFNGGGGDSRNVTAGRVSPAGSIALAMSLPKWLSGSVPGVVAHRAVSDGASGVIAAWDVASAPGFFAQRWTAAGAATWADSLPAPFMDAIGPDGTGGAWLAGRAKSAPNRLAILRRDGDGSSPSLWDAAGTTIAEPVALGAVSGWFGSGAALLAWAEDRGGGGGADIRATVVRPNGHLAIGYSPGGEPICDVAGDQVNPVWAEGSQIVAWEDHRNAGSSGTDVYANYFMGPVGGVDVPPIAGGATRLAIRSLAPNPARGALRLALTLVPGEPARIDLVNVRGRAVRIQSVAAGGEAATAVVPTVGLPSGLYFVRVLQGGDVAGARVVVLD